MANEVFDPTTLRALLFYREKLAKVQETWVEWSENYKILQAEIDAIDVRLSLPIVLRLAC